ncbi:MAG: hypothetical protein KDD76_03090 [Rickettsiales bacterium]|nr:hypothetical protein [Rickettsiales bacterium]
MRFLLMILPLITGSLVTIANAHAQTPAYDTLPMQLDSSSGSTAPVPNPSGTAAKPPPSQSDLLVHFRDRCKDMPQHLQYCEGYRCQVELPGIPGSHAIAEIRGTAIAGGCNFAMEIHISNFEPIVYECQLSNVTRQALARQMFHSFANPEDKIMSNDVKLVSENTKKECIIRGTEAFIKNFNDAKKAAGKPVQ